MADEKGTLARLLRNVFSAWMASGYPESPCPVVRPAPPIGQPMTPVTRLPQNKKKYFNQKYNLFALKFHF